MLKSAAALLVLALCSLPLPSQEKPSLQTGPDPYLGPVHTVHVEKSVSRNGGEPRKNVVLDATYDEHGYATSSTSYRDDGTIHQKLAWESTYDAQGRVTQRRYINATGDLTNTGVYTYPKERVVELDQVNPDGSLNHHAIQLYDEAGNMVAVSRRYPALGKMFSETTTYDDRGNPIERRNYDENSVLKQRSVGTYDAYGHALQWTVYESDGKTYQVTNRTLQCDAKGHIVKAVNLSRDGAVQNTETMTYVFDEHGNWTRKTTVREFPHGGQETEILERTITYY